MKGRPASPPAELPFSSLLHGHAHSRAKTKGAGSLLHPRYVARLFDFLMVVGRPTLIMRLEAHWIPQYCTNELYSCGSACQRQKMPKIKGNRIAEEGVAAPADISCETRDFDSLSHHIVFIVAIVVGALSRGLRKLYTLGTYRNDYSSKPAIMVHILRKKL